MAMFSLLGPVVLLGIVIVTAITVVITSLLFKREKKMKLKASIEGEKIDRMFADGKISESEADELKRAVGAYSISEEKGTKEDSHILITGILHIAHGILGGLGTALIFFILFVGVFHVAPAAEKAGEPLPGVFLMPGGIIMLFILIISVFIFIEVIAGVFLIKRRNWARFIIIGFSIFITFSFPLGTALGIYSLWVLLFREDSNRYFEMDRN